MTTDKDPDTNKPKFYYYHCNLCGWKGQHVKLDYKCTICLGPIQYE